MSDEVVLSGATPSQVDSDIAICNLALLKLGNADNYIESLDDATKEARACKAFYTHILNICIDDYPWNCMVKQAVLTKDEAFPLFGFDYYYALPDDCVRILSVSDSEDYEDINGLDWRRQGRYIYTNAEAIYLTYLWNNTDVATYDHRFIQAFSSRLAIELSKSILGIPTTVVQSLWMEYEAIVSDMRTRDVLESYQKQRGESEMVSVR